MRFDFLNIYSYALLSIRASAMKRQFRSCLYTVLRMVQRLSPNLVTLLHDIPKHYKLFEVEAHYKSVCFKTKNAIVVTKAIICMKQNVCSKSKIFVSLSI